MLLLSALPNVFFRQAQIGEFHLRSAVQLGIQPRFILRGIHRIAEIVDALRHDVIAQRRRIIAVKGIGPETVPRPSLVVGPASLSKTVLIEGQKGKFPAFVCLPPLYAFMMGGTIQEKGLSHLRFSTGDGTIPC